MPAYPTPRAVVLTSRGVFYDSGRHHALSDRLKLNDLGAVLAGAQQAFAAGVRGGEGVVVVDTPMPTPQDKRLAHEHTRMWAERLPDWKFTEINPWTTFVNEYAVVHLGFMPDIAKKPGPLLAGACSSLDIAQRLGRYHMLTGVPWRYTAGVSGCVGMRTRYTDPRPGKQPLWISQGPKGISGAGPLIWRGHTPSGDADALVVMFDVNAQYLAALKNARLAWGGLERTGAVAFDPSWPGFWELAAGDIPDVLLDGKRRPPIIRGERVHKGGLWVSTPVAKYLTDLLGTIDVLDSWTCKNGETIGRAFAERLIAARQGNFGPLGDAELAVKRTYAELVGMMGRPGGSVFRPDWSSTVMDLARVNFLRRLDKADAVSGARLIEVRTDAAFYHIDDATVIEQLIPLLGVGFGPGTFKKPVLLTAADYRKQLRGRK